MLLLRRALRVGVPVAAASSVVVAVTALRARSTLECEHASTLVAPWTPSSAPKGKKPAHLDISLQDEFDVVIVGGGIIGLATAREVLRRYPRLTVVVLEKEREVAAHQTGHNSGVIHAGMYYVPGSVMAKTCVRGSKLMYEYADAHKIPVSRCGKLIVASTPAEHAQVEKLFAQGNANGVPGLAVLTGDQVKSVEPNVAAHSALWSPNTGIIDYAVVSRSLAEEILATGRADIRLSFEAKVRGRGRSRCIRGANGLQPGDEG